MLQRALTGLKSIDGGSIVSIHHCMQPANGILDNSFRIRPELRKLHCCNHCYKMLVWLNEHTASVEYLYEVPVLEIK